MTTYLLVPVVLYFGITSVVYCAQPFGHRQLAVVQLGLFFVIMLATWRIRKGWDQEIVQREREHR